MVRTSDSMARAARNFLRTGKTGRNDLKLLAEQCDCLVRAETQKSLPGALEMARKFVAQVRRQPNMPLQLALRSLGWAAHASGKYSLAEKAYLEARQLVIRVPGIRARIDRILIDTYMYKGDLVEARRRAQSSISTFRRIRENDEVAKTRINYGNLFHRQDRHKEAKKQYDLARRQLERRSGNDLVLGLNYYNLANTLVQLLDFRQASKYYCRARDLFDKLGFHLYVTECEYGLAWLSMLEGDYHLALRGLDKCEKSYDKAGHKKGVMLCRLDRAEAYLGLNLFSDAYTTACDAERHAKRLQLGYEMSKAAFFRAKAAHACGHDRDVKKALTRARLGFTQVKNSGFEAAVRLFETQIKNGRKIDQRVFKSVRRLFSRAQLPLWEAICDLHYIVDRPADKNVRKRLANNKAVKSVPHLLARWQTIQGDGHYLKGNVDVAIEYWTRAANVLDIARAKLPPVEMRAAFMRGKSDPYERMISHDAESNPQRAAIWADRFKTAGVWAASADSFSGMSERRQVEISLAELSRQVSALSGQLGSISETRSGASLGSHPTLQKLHKQVRDNLLTMEYEQTGIGRRNEQLITDIRMYSTKMPIVQFHFEQNDLIAFIHSSGATRAHRFRDGRRKVNEMIGLWQILLSRTLIDAEQRSPNDQKDEDKLFAEFGDYLWASLEIEKKHERVLIIPDGSLANLPWAAISHDGESLIDRHSFLLSPTLQHFGHASRLKCTGDKVGLFVGETTDLGHTRGEIRAILNLCPKAELVDPCSRSDWPDEGDWFAWHYIGHARHRSDNPSYSSLSLSDGPLFGADLRLKRCRVGLVTLAACRTAHQSVLPGEESTGLIRCLLEMGARNVVGSHWAVSDKSAAVWMSSFYKSLLSGQTATTAVREASIDTRENYQSVYDWAPFSVFGAG